MATPHKHSTKIMEISKFRILPSAKFDGKNDGGIYLSAFCFSILFHMGPSGETGLED
jgi:hypothetical protein